MAEFVRGPAVNKGGGIASIQRVSRGSLRPARILREIVRAMNMGITVRDRLPLTTHPRDEAQRHCK